MTQGDNLSVPGKEGLESRNDAMQGTGLVKEHCSPRCKQQAYRERKKVEEALRAEEEDLTRRAETRIAEGART